MSEDEVVFVVFTAVVIEVVMIMSLLLWVYTQECRHSDQRFGSVICFSAQPALCVLQNVTAEQEARCAVCLEQLIVASKAPCGHLYHKECLLQWMRHSNTCPLCRRDILPLPLTDHSQSMDARVML